MPQGCMASGGDTPPLHARLMPSHCLPNAKCQTQWHLQPKVTAPNRFGNLLQPPVQPLPFFFYCIPGVPPLPLAQGAEAPLVRRPTTVPLSPTENICPRLLGSAIGRGF